MMEEQGVKHIVSQNIKRLRKEQNMTQAQLAEYTDLSNTYIANIECGKTWISDTTLEKMARALHTDFYLFFMPDAAKEHEGAEAQPPFHRVLQKYEDSLKKDIENSFRQLHKELS